jgi:hypothetical protein
VQTTGRSRRRGAGALLAALCWLSVPIRADATHYSMRVQLAEGTQLSDTGSGIELTKIVLWRFIPKFEFDDPNSASTLDVECVAFVNHDPRTANHVAVRFSYVGADGSELGSDTLDARGTFSRGAEIPITAKDPPGPALRISETCRQVRGFEWGGDGGRHAAYGARPKSVTITASVRDVDYQDGTSWHDVQHMTAH